MSAVKEIVRGVLPERAIWEINHRLGRTWTKEIDLDAAAVFAEADLEALRSPRRLEELLPRLGLNDDVPAWMPSELQPFLGKGLRVWQYPNQFGPYLASLAGLHIRSYLEIGVQHGGSFAATLTFLHRVKGQPLYGDAGVPGAAERAACEGHRGRHGVRARSGAHRARACKRAAARHPQRHARVP